MEHIDPKKLAVAPLEPEAAAKAAGLRYVDDSAPGFSRKKVGTGFGFRDTDGKIIRDPEVIKRIRSIGIPPAYTDVWICPHPRGHIQATAIRRNTRTCSNSPARCQKSARASVPT
jgi:DNA topoisomerase-1